MDDNLRREIILDNYTNPENKGRVEDKDYPLELLVHGKSGKPCPKCNTILEKTRIGGRGTSYCKKCQK